MMAERPEKSRPARRAAVFFLGEALVLYALLGLPVLLAGMAPGGFISLGLLLAYLVWTFVSASRRSGELSPSWLRMSVFAVLHTISGTVALSAILLWLVVGWYRFAYRIPFADGRWQSPEIIVSGAKGSLLVGGIALYAAVLILAISFVFLRREGEGVIAVHRRLGADGIRCFGHTVGP